MNRKKIILFNITSRCNESCSFCLKSSFLKKGLSDLDLQEIKENYFFLKKSNHISHVVLTGGEPTLHSNFLKILDFFESQNVDISLVTNLLRISQSNYFFSKIKPYFSKDKNNRIIASVNHLPSFSQKEKQRALGFIKILQNQLNFGLTILIYKENIDTLGELSLWLRDNIERYYRGIFEIELRFLYFSETPKDILIDSLPKEKQVAPTVSDFLAPWSNTDLPVNIMPSRFPLCYINNFNKIDLGVISKGYYSDTAFTCAIGEVAPIVRKLIEATQKALNEAIVAAKINNTLGDIGFAIEKTGKSYGFSVIKALTGHGVGFSLHEDPTVYNFGKRGEGLVLKPGMVLAIEPMLSTGSWEIVQRPDESWATADGGLSAHFEHTIVITEKGQKVLT